MKYKKVVCWNLELTVIERNTHVNVSFHCVGNLAIHLNWMRFLRRKRDRHHWGLGFRLCHFFLRDNMLKWKTLALIELTKASQIITQLHHVPVHVRLTSYWHHYSIFVKFLIPTWFNLIWLFMALFLLFGSISTWHCLFVVCLLMLLVKYLIKNCLLF